MPLHLIVRNNGDGNIIGKAIDRHGTVESSTGYILFLWPEHGNIGDRVWVYYENAGCTGQTYHNTMPTPEQFIDLCLTTNFTTQDLRSMSLELLLSPWETVMDIQMALKRQDMWKSIQTIRELLMFRT